MNQSIPYIIEASVCLMVFYALYAIVLRHFTFFQANRFYLLSGAVLSFVIPFLSIPVFKTNYNLVLKTVDALPADYIESLPVAAKNVEVVGSFSLSTMLWVIYAAGVLVLLIRLILSLRKIFVLKGLGSSETHQACTIIRLHDVQPFSFGKWIFLPHGHVDPLIVEHERLHVQQLHWCDLLVVEIAKCVMWFNPIAYGYKKAIQLQHEYLADHFAVQSHGRLEDYMRAVMTQLRANTISMPVNRFHSLSIKKRILMMTQKQTSRFRLMWYALALPIVAMLLFSFAFTSKEKIVVRPRPVVPVATTPYVQDHVPAIFPVDISAVKTVVEYGERMHPLLKTMRMHTGLDFMVAEGSQIVATADGFILEAGYNGAHGNFVKIKHGDTYSTHYSHMKEFIVKAGQNVKAGETIGYVGSTGLSTGPHLHYEVYQKEKQVDPKAFMPKIGC